MISNKSSNKQNSNKTKKRAAIIIALVAVVLIGGLVISQLGDNSTQANVQQAAITGEGVKITKSEITEKATFIPYQAGDTYMEVVTIRASDGTVRTALNTCQICNGSGRGYYEQEGDVLVCQNCGNRFTVDQVEIVRGGCNPVPIQSHEKTETEDSIIITDDFMQKNKSLFNNWKI